MSEPFCDCGHAEDEHEDNTHGQPAECTVPGCDCVHFEWDGDEDDDDDEF